MFVIFAIFSAWIALLSGVAVAAIGARNLGRYSHAIPGTGPIDFRDALVAVRGSAWPARNGRLDVTGLVLAAIAGYGVAPQHVHAYSTEGQLL